MMTAISIRAAERTSAPTTTDKARSARDRVAQVVDHADAAAQGVAHAAARVGTRARVKLSPAIRQSREGVRAVRAAPDLGRSASQALEGLKQLGEQKAVLTAERAVSRASTATKVAAKVGRVAVPVAVVLGVADIAFGIHADKGYGRQAQEATGRVAGSATGAWVGAMVGTALIPIPGVGTAVGALAGGLLGSYAGEKLAEPVAAGVRAAREGVSNLAEAGADVAEDAVNGLKDGFEGAANLVSGWFD
jgi:uncharacterized membrane protein